MDMFVYKKYICMIVIKFNYFKYIQKRDFY